MIVKNSSRNTTFVRVFIFCLLLMPSVAGAAIEDHITRTETGFYYTIQKGDTLWDLSRQFSDSSWVWPDLWSQNNPQILNPHRIYPGQKILVYKKGWEGAEKRAAAATPAPAAKPSEPVEKDAAPFHIFTKIDRVGFIRQTQTPHHGTIFKSKNDLALIDEGTMVYIYPEPGAPALTVGGKYTIFRTFDRITDPETEKDIGVQHLLTGVVEITAVEPEFATGDIVDCYRDIRIDDRIMPYMLRNTNLPVRQGVEGLFGRVIKPEGDEILIGENALVFINKGENDGIETGQKYSIFFQESARPNPDEVKQVALTPRRIGDVVVLHTEPTTSTALVTNSKEQILAGNIIKTLVENR